MTQPQSFAYNGHCHRLKDHDFGLPELQPDGRFRWTCRWCGEMIELSAEARERVIADATGPLRDKLVQP